MMDLQLDYHRYGDVELIAMVEPRQISVYRLVHEQGAVAESLEHLGKHHRRNTRPTDHWMASYIKDMA